MQSAAPAHLLVEAERHMVAGEFAAARAVCRQILASQPGHRGAMLQLSYIESLSGTYRVAREWALRAADVTGPIGTDDALALIKRLRTFNAVDRLSRLVDLLLEDRATPALVLVECAGQLSNLNHHDLALRCAEQAVRSAPGDMLARMMRGQQLAQHGRMDEAASDFEAVLAKAPGSGSAWWSLARLSKQTRGSNHVARLQALLRAPGLHPANIAAIAYALHKELDDLGDTDAAWAALEQACRAKRGLLNYDREDSRRLVRALLGFPPGRAGEGKPGAGTKTPIFIVGMHRSGTTLLEQMLDGSPQVRGVGELYDFTSAMRHATDHHCRGVIDTTLVEHAEGADFAEAGRYYLDGMQWRLGSEPFFTDKLPSNFLNIGFICRALPHARILHMVRDPVETCFSNLRELFSEANPYAYDQHELADYFLQYRRLMAHWHAVHPGRILDVDYAALTRDPEATMRAVCDYCGLDYVDAMRDPRSSRRAVATASVVQVREGVVRREVPKWAPYANYLQPLIQALRTGGVGIADLPA